MSGEAYGCHQGPDRSAGFEDMGYFRRWSTLPMENSLSLILILRKFLGQERQTKEPIYLVGGDMGVEGRLTKLKEHSDHIFRFFNNWLRLSECKTII